MGKAAEEDNIPPECLRKVILRRDRN